MFKSKNFLLLFLFISTISYGVDKPLFSTNQKKCTGCALLNREIESVGGIIASTLYFEAQQDCFIPIPGFITINSRRHVQSIDDFTQEERADFIEFLYKVRKNMRETLNIETIYMIQEEDASHFHVWLFPHYDWMEKFEKKVSSIISIMRWAKEHLKTEENLEHVLMSAQILKQSFAIFH